MSEEEYLKKYLHREQVEEELKRVKKGEAIQYVVGNVDFYGYPFLVNPNVLIPRWETEELVDRTLKLLKEHFIHPSILDIGTGSGCIAITLSKKIEGTVDACDVSKEALAVAEKNNKINQANVTFIESDLFFNIQKKYDCIISNPPYISKTEEIMDVVKNNEPHIALYAEENGLYFYKEILKNAHKFIHQKYLLAFEIGASQKKAILSLATSLFLEAQIWCEQDLNGLDRYIFILKK